MPGGDGGADAESMGENPLKGLVWLPKESGFWPSGRRKGGRVTSLGTCFREGAPGSLRRAGHWVQTELAMDGRRNPNRAHAEADNLEVRGRASPAWTLLSTCHRHHCMHHSQLLSSFLSINEKQTWKSSGYINNLHLTWIQKEVG